VNLFAHNRKITWVIIWGLVTSTPFVNVSSYDELPLIRKLLPPNSLSGNEMINESSEDQPRGGDSFGHRLECDESAMVSRAGKLRFKV